jgi:hypothetical protein
MTYNNDMIAICLYGIWIPVMFNIHVTNLVIVYKLFMGGHFYSEYLQKLLQCYFKEKKKQKNAQN